jgi:hypothetical protein
MEGTFEEAVTQGGYDGAPEGCYTYFARWKPVHGRGISGFHLILAEDIALHGLEVCVQRVRDNMQKHLTDCRSGGDHHAC